MSKINRLKKVLFWLVVTAVIGFTFACGGGGGGGSKSEGVDVGDGVHKIVKLSNLSSLGDSDYVFLYPAGVQYDKVSDDMWSIMMYQLYKMYPEYMSGDSGVDLRDISFAAFSSSSALFSKLGASFQNGTASFPLYTKNDKKFTGTGSYYVWFMNSNYDVYRSAEKVTFTTASVTLDMDAASSDFVTDWYVNYYDGEGEGENAETLHDTKFNVLAVDRPQGGTEITWTELSAKLIPNNPAPYTLDLYNLEYLNASFKKAEDKWWLTTGTFYNDFYKCFQKNYNYEHDNKFQLYRETSNLPFAEPPVWKCELFDEKNGGCTLAEGAFKYEWLKGDNKGTKRPTAHEHGSGGGDEGYTYKYFIYPDQTIVLDGNTDVCIVYASIPVHLPETECTSFTWFSKTRGYVVKWASYSDSYSHPDVYDHQYLTYYYPHKTSFDESVLVPPASVAFTLVSQY